jgi:predicted transcriptional regulator
MNKNVMEIATSKVESVKSETPLTEIASLFGYSQLKKVPVIDANKLVGVINRSRFSRHLLENACQA